MIMNNYKINKGWVELFGEGGIITQCPHCSKVRNPQDGEFVRVPYLEFNALPDTEDGICKSCFEEYYPEAFREEELWSNI